MLLKERVVERVDVLEVDLRSALLILGVDTHLVIQDAVHAQVAKADFALYGRKLRLPVGAQPLLCAACANNAKRHVAVRPCHSGKIRVDMPGRLCHGVAGGDDQPKQEETREMQQRQGPTISIHPTTLPFCGRR